MSSVSESFSAQNPSAERIPAAERREQILAAASQVFGARGYAGATTDQVAQAAGISQPYVVRMFGTKENLFIEVIERSLSRLMTVFRGEIAKTDPQAADPADTDPAYTDLLSARLGRAYIDLIEDRGILLSLMHGFLTGHDPAIGAAARTGFLDIYRLLRDEAGFEPDQVREFLADGMLFNTLLALRLPDAYDNDEAARELMDCTFRTKLDLVLGASAAHWSEETA
ncbi:TetR/AcrR family transcriptional regulator [Glaciibacter psychrotolerans]|uniref:AcrR family transcriptional regulator n=1 Tax=Glaciibacter psychrotolerans TaxID=670054 RepID=A0A7Z0EE65_9MICO|nr:TetR/AcrR family transcriptional regulator [Leifsonia psychrotolerans]NYJ20019.1 AcrR family transcriptional regulator [Leifsonia psychrotolerans]